MDILRRSRRSKSFSFSDTISNDTSTPLQYLGIPFSWEQFPGIPKNTHTNDDSSQSLLPLPPSGNSGHHSPAMKKYRSSRSFRNDPFLAAFVECSKDKEYEIDGRSKCPASDRSGFVVSMYSSCKRSCAVSESIVYRPRSATGYILATNEGLTVAKSKS
ncbi:hypothetical protein R6Q57_023046 [Mikania cordata]